jgi:ubiquinone/menaquinone biosynthesis C-methylase UbiE
MPEHDEVHLQRQYYTNTAQHYDNDHLVGGDPEQVFALGLLAGILYNQPAQTILDIGAGTGRVGQYLAKIHPKIKVLGIEPVEALRKAGHEAGVPTDLLIDGDATKLAYPDASFDLVTSFAVLHHIKNPELAIAEMLRVAKKGIFISDANNFGQGRALKRMVQYTGSFLGLWHVLVALQTRGQGYAYSEGDGIFYPFSLFRYVKQIRQRFPDVHLMSTKPTGTPNLRFSSPHIALFAVK